MSGVSRVTVVKGFVPQAEKAMDKYEKKAWGCIAVVIAAEFPATFVYCADAQSDAQASQGHAHGLGSFVLLKRKPQS